MDFLSLYTNIDHAEGAQAYSDEQKSKMKRTKNSCHQYSDKNNLNVFTSDRPTTFLDADIRILTRKLKTNLHRKTTNTPQYLNKAFYYPPNVIKSIPKGQLIGICRIPSEKSDYFKHSNDMVKSFIEQENEKKNNSRLKASSSN